MCILRADSYKVDGKDIIKVSIFPDGLDYAVSDYNNFACMLVESKESVESYQTVGNYLRPMVCSLS